MARRNRVNTVRLQVTVDEVTNKLLEEMAPAGIAGRNGPDVASWIIREWIWHNPEALARTGVSIKSVMKNRSRTNAT
jgi:hypothetical protein